jgi:hypothetical protein
MRLVFVAFAVALLGCSKDKPSGNDTVATSSSVTSAKPSASSAIATTASAKTQATPASPPVGACVFEGEATVVGTLLRADSGVSLGLSTKALGWSTKEGTAAVATYGDEGVVAKADVANPSAELDAKAAKGTVRIVKRVVPLDLKDGKVRVAIDYVDADATAKHRTLHCGPPDAWLVSFDGPSMTEGDASATTETLDCRTVLTDKVVAVESVLAKNGGTLTATLSLGGVPFAKRDKSEPPSERWGFTMVNAAHGGAGDVVVGRWNGLLVVGRKGKDPTSDFDAWLGTPVTAPVAAIGAAGEGVEIWHTLTGKPDVYALRFDIDTKKPGTPGTASLGDAEAADERGYLSATRRELDTIVATTAKSGDKRSVDLFRYDAGGTLIGRTHVGAADEKVLEAKVAPLAGNKVLVAYIAQDGWKNTLKTQVATCGDATSAPAAPVETDH